MNSTVEYYNKNAEDYYKRTVDVDMNSLYNEFLNHVKKEGHILDLGCGSGRDSLYFLNNGYRVTAVDASRELVKLSSNLINQEVLHLKFKEINFKGEFDGIWACASLLHVSKKRIESILGRLVKALVRGGVMYMSFKYGNCEIKKNGRLFNYYDEESFKEVNNKFKRLKIIKMWKTEDKREDRKGEPWFNLLVKKVRKKEGKND